MKKLAAYCCATILLWGIFASGALAATKLFGPEKSDNGSLPINIKAVQLSYDNKGENLTAKGNVEIEQGSRLLKADYVKINIETKDTEAKGNVELNENGDILSCDAFNINLDTQMGHVENAKLFVKQDNLHITGKDISKLGANTYEIKQGTITTCDSESPPWRIDAKKMNVTIDGYATVQDSIFRIKKIPVAYLPFAVYPVKTSRQSGFLFPEISLSSRKGTELNNSFFWAISENTDSTIWLDAASDKGLGTGLEYRFKLKEDSWGKVYGYFADESSSYFNNEYSDPKDRKNQRGYLNFEGEHYFNQDAYVKAQGSYLTDREFYGDYRKEVRRSKDQTDDIVNIGSRPYDESLIFYNKNWESSNLLVKTEYYKNLNNSDHYISQPLPQAAFSTMRLPLSNSPFFYQFDTAYDYFYRQEGVKGNRFDMYPKISLPLSRDGWLKLDTEVGVRAVAYTGIKNDDGSNDSTIFPTVDSKLSADFVRIFSIDGKVLQKLRHTITPTLFYQYTANDDQDDTPYFDVPENFYRVHRVGYYLKNRIAGLFNTPTGDYEEDELGYFLIGQSYNIIHPHDALYTEGDPEKSYSDVFADLRVNLTRALYFRTKAAYMHSEDRLRYYKALLTWSNQFDEYFDIGYVYEWQRFTGYRTRARFKLMTPLYAFLTLRYNNNSFDKINSEVGIDYFSQCWGSQLSVETRGASSGRRSETIFNYKFYLKGLGNAPKGSGVLIGMKAKVYFADLRAHSARNLSDKIRALLDQSGLASVIHRNNLTAVKIHFGEKGNTSFIRPIFIRDIIDSITFLGGKPFLTDTNTLYRGERSEAVSHVAIALVHGFNFTALATPVIIADGLRGTDETRITIRAKHFQEVLIGSAITNADAMVCVSHFKGHELSGFGGALKNLGMGCASREGKMKQHTDISPVIERKECTACGSCIDQCPVQAIDFSKKKASINTCTCIGCAKCITVCPQGAVKISWDGNNHLFQEKMVEYALGVINNKKNKLLFINFLTDISPQCDCYGHADQSIVPDIGILASTDPVAIDQASADLVNAQQGHINSALTKNHKPQQDKFRGIYPSVDWEVQLDYAQQLYIGTRRYKLIRVS